MKKYDPQIQQKSISYPSFPLKHEMGIIPRLRVMNGETFTRSSFIHSQLETFAFLVFSCQFEYHANGELWLYIRSLFVKQRLNLY